jgi:hypothetical protein
MKVKVNELKYLTSGKLLIELGSFYVSTAEWRCFDSVLSPQMASFHSHGYGFSRGRDFVNILTSSSSLFNSSYAGAGPRSPMTSSYEGAGAGVGAFIVATLSYEGGGADVLLSLAQWSSGSGILLPMTEIEYQGCISTLVPW